MPVLEVKKILERRCSIPTHLQSLVVGGKALSGDLPHSLFLSYTLSLSPSPSPSLPSFPPPIPPSTLSLFLSLSDSQRLCDCDIRSGARLFLAQRSTPTPPPPPPSQPPIWDHRTDFWDRLQSYLIQHFSQSDAERIIHRMEGVSV